MTLTLNPDSAGTVRFPLELYPDINPFALDLVRGVETATRFCNRIPLSSMQPTGQPRGQGELTEALTVSNAGSGNDVRTELEAWNAGETVTLIAGQQVGFAGGPLYTLAKIASLIRMKRDFAARGIRATTFFWLATEDHDYDEIAQLTVEGLNGLETLRATERPRGRFCVGPLPIPESLGEQFRRSVTHEMQSWLRPGVSFAASFSELISQVFHGESVVLVDSLLPELRRAGRPFLTEFVRQIDTSTKLIADRSEELIAAGYEPQVTRNKEGAFSFLYRISDAGERLAIDKQADIWRVGSKQRTLDEILQDIDDSPERMSTGALVRPLFQDFVFRPDVFIGGPAEVAYYAQIGGLREHFRIPQPHVSLRGHLLITSEIEMRKISRYALTPNELFADPNDLLIRRSKQAVEEFQLDAAAIEARILNDVRELASSILESDPHLERSLARSERRIRFHLEKVRSRGVLAVARRDRERSVALERMHQTLMPGGKVQDRLLGWIGLWLQYGPELIRRMTDSIESDSDRVTILAL